MLTIHGLDAATCERLLSLFSEGVGPKHAAERTGADRYRTQRLWELARRHGLVSIVELNIDAENRRIVAAAADLERVMVTRFSRQALCYRARVSMETGSAAVQRCIDAGYLGVASRVDLHQSQLHLTDKGRSLVGWHRPWVASDAAHVAPIAGLHDGLRP